MSENPPAFPSVCLGDPGHPSSVPGMSLRDWFAGQAPTAPDGFAQADAPRWPESKLWSEYGDEYNRQLAAWAAVRHARWAYAFADAMLATRMKGLDDE